MGGRSARLVPANTPHCSEIRQTASISVLSSFNDTNIDQGDVNLQNNEQFTGSRTKRELDRLRSTDPAVLKQLEPQDEHRKSIKRSPAEPGSSRSSKGKKKGKTTKKTKKAGATPGGAKERNGNDTEPPETVYDPKSATLLSNQPPSTPSSSLLAGLLSPGNLPTSAGGQIVIQNLTVHLHVPPELKK